MHLSEEHVILRDTVRRFTDEQIVPHADRMDREGVLPEGLFRQLGELGVLGVTIPEEYGGAGFDVLAQVLIMEELARGSAAVSTSYGSTANLCAHNLWKHGTEAQRRKYLPDLCSGNKIGSLALTEPGAGSDAVGIQTGAVKNKDHYILNGTKMFITNAPIADLMIVYAKTDKSKGAHGITAFLVERGFKGFSVSRKLDKLGHRASPTGEVVFEDCQVPVGNVLGEVNKGIKVMMSGLDVERVVAAAESLGIAEAAFAEALKYSKERKQFGKPICEFELIQAKLADMYTGIESARAFLYDVAARSNWKENLRK
ncbi:MAG: acyl-CoA dehydrogenase family protein, partial [Desulfuromonadales bacterium]